tara:strand:+ start:199 stop:423 length:225 start_codon:yes stop_codon:yes gene_type:complete
MEIKLNKNLRTALITVALVSTSYALGTQNGEQNILERWENRWFTSEWYDTKTIEEFLYDTQWENLGQELNAYED